MNNKIIAYVASGIVVAAVVAAFVTVGSPAKQRAQRFDERRVQDLQNIQSQVINYWQQKSSLPQNLSDLKDSISGFTPPNDPEKDIPYEYVVKSPTSFDLCAVFSLPNKSKTSIPMYYESNGQNWIHGSGRACFERTIDPELYQKIPPINIMK